MRYLQLVVLASAAVLMLSACGHSNSGSNPSPNLNSAEKVFAADPNGEASDIVDAATLAADLDGLFGDENAEPVAVNPGDTIDDVLDRAKNG